MKRTLNLVRKDLRRMVGPLALWLVVAVTEQVFVWKQLWFAPIDSQTLGKALAVLTALGLGVTFLIAAAMVQHDRLVGTNAWWLTRPVSRRRLLAAKALAVGLAGVALPVIARLPLWIALHFEAQDMVAAIAETAAKQLLAVLPAVTVATLTDNLGRFIVWSMVVAFVILTGPVLWGGMALLDIRNGNPLQQSRALVELAILVGAAGAVILTQYLSGRVAVSVVLLASGIAATAITAPRWTIDLGEFLVADGRAHDFHPERARDVSLKIRSVKTHTDPGHRTSFVAVTFDLPGVPAGLQWITSPVEHTFVWPSGLKLRPVGAFERRWDENGFRSALGMGRAEPDVETERWIAERLAEIRAKHPGDHRRPPLETDGRAVVNLRPGIAALIPEQRPSYTMAADVHLIRPTIALEVPVRAGARSTGKGYSVHVLTAKRIPGPPRGRADLIPRNEIATTAVLGSPVLLRDRLLTTGRPLRAFDDRVARGTPASALVLDRTTGTLGGWLDLDARDVVVDCVAIRRQIASWPEPSNRRGGAWVPVDPAFLEHASIAVVESLEVARVWREARIEHLTGRE